DPSFQLALRLAGELQEHVHRRSYGWGSVGVHEATAARDAGAPTAEVAVRLGGHGHHHLVVQARPAALGWSVAHGFPEGNTLPARGSKEVPPASASLRCAARSSAARPSCSATVITSFSAVPTARRASSSS